MTEAESDARIALRVAGKPVVLTLEDMRRHFERDIAPGIKKEVYKTLPIFWRDEVFEPQNLLNLNLGHEAPWTTLSKRSDLTLEIVYDYTRTHYDDPWNYKALSWNSALRWDLVLLAVYEANRYELYGDAVIATARGISPKWAAHAWRGDIDMRGICTNPHVTWETVCSAPLLEWDKPGLLFNPNITPEIVSNNPYGPPGCRPNWKWVIEISATKV